MHKLFLSITFLLLQITSFANDGAFFAAGNQLIPINESEISVKKEILTLKKVRHDFIEVSVYYEFFNPAEAKTITVGFEAFSPNGDVDGTPKNGRHPYMRDFTVVLNNTTLPYEVAYVQDSLSNQKEKIIAIDLDTFEGHKSGNYVEFHYVYHFKASFKKGLNTIKHTYNYDLSGGVCYNYYFEYILTAANRWGNGQIDDFTLIIDSGPFESFHIEQSFFDNNSNWMINGIGKMEHTWVDNRPYTTFYIQKGRLTFQAKNFKPNGELFVHSPSCLDGVIDKKLLYSYYAQNWMYEPANDFERKTYKNLPFARRGYVFKNVALKQYYENMPWYMPNPNYIPVVANLHELEKKWIEQYK